ncbi:tRNA (adenosine(37)-N6)-dimethylallyltransferase MiaA [Novosphingobium sp. KACC 22771]|uniref:tRNA (adenosine(37)-N6)-dimethylallyltransferase MiaA n=1 Tax=Novosphingobium sp. KACC 22771 TaxID=3025670 RepID=UPI0023672E04|nr:tRNA (adenosine(37)-N6)-dimethylallyltransferase MiaA [Novosphingobium sp. KACC 22771]WDF71671.1 tRNA (adenosine(37)-N6)-dimethylallyltransferase MiaA [Novosphingobium sp. KACC 22771]
MSTEISLHSSTGPSARPLVGLIAGPTASGKSDIAMSLARALESSGRRAVIVNADSAQLYADLPVLSAAPSAQEQAEVPHRLYGAWDGAQSCSAADWAARAREEIAAAHGAGAVPILVGGTGLYLRTLLYGIAPVPEIAPSVREAVRAMPVEAAYPELTRLDPERAAALHANDTTRVHRALEVVLSTGQTLSHWQQRLEGGIGESIRLSPLVLLPDRDWLYERCDRRFGLMVRQGALEEVEALMARGLDPALPVMRAIGVSSLAAHLRGEMTLAEAMADGAQATRQYAKRQYTWFRHQPPAHWPRASDTNFTIKSHFDILFHD